MMSTLKYQIIHCQAFNDIRTYNKSHLKMKERAVRTGEPAPKQRMPTDNSFQQYITHAIRFGAWCKATYGCKQFDQCGTYVQDYIDDLIERGKSPSTIHTYLAGVCCAWGIPMAEIKKPRRRAAENTRSRGKKAVDNRNDSKRERSSRYYDFAAVVGIRRAEYKHLRQCNFVQDESNYWCVHVRKGKGGRQQLQRIPPGQEDFIRSFFDGSDSYVFSKEEIKNKIDIHHLRHLAAWNAYQGYLTCMKNEPGYRAQLYEEIEHRWCKYNNRPFDPLEAQGSYHVRGKNRELASKNGLPTKYDRLALLATSIFHLSHWRNNVAANNYLLAISHEEYLDIVSRSQKNQT